MSVDLKAAKDAADAAAKRGADTKYIDGMWVEAETLYLLAAAEYVEGDDESGWRFTAEGATWIKNTLGGLAREHWR